MAFDSTKFRKTMRLWATGVTIITVKHGDEMRGLTVSSFTSVTLEPPLILVCVQKTADAAPVILESGTFAVSMLGQDQEELSNIFAGLDPQAKHGADRFAGLDLQFASTGSPIFAAAMGWLDCKVHSIHDGSTHHIIIGEVVEASGQPEEGNVQAPLLYYNTEYHQLG